MADPRCKLHEMKIVRKESTASFDSDIIILDVTIMDIIVVELP